MRDLRYAVRIVRRPPGLTLVALAACVFPIRRATPIDPFRALRQDQP